MRGTLAGEEMAFEASLDPLLLLHLRARMHTLAEKFAFPFPGGNAWKALFAFASSFSRMPKVNFEPKFFFAGAKKRQTFRLFVMKKASLFEGSDSMTFSCWRKGIPCFPGVERKRRRPFFLG